MKIISDLKMMNFKHKEINPKEDNSNIPTNALVRTYGKYNTGVH